MSSFFLPDLTPQVEVTIPANVTKAQLLAFRPFKNWLETLQESIAVQQSNERHAFHHDGPYKLLSISVDAVKWAGSRILFVLMETVVQSSSDPRPLPGIVFLRGGSVAILMILRPTNDPDKRFVVMTQQPRVPAASLAFWEIPAGMIDDAGEFAGAAANEIREETGLKVPRYELVNMTELALRNASGVESHLQKAMYPSPGGCDEFIPLFLWERVMSVQGIEQLRGKLTGNRHEREKIQVRLVEYKELWKEGARDAKTLAAWALYENLIREGSL
jgi:ADP-sugar diphosphatase